MAKNTTDKRKDKNPDLDLAFQGINKKFGEGAHGALGRAGRDCWRGHLSCFPSRADGNGTDTLC